MSWDVLVHRVEGPPPRVEDIPDDHQFPPLGPAEEVRARISEALPAVDWADPSWGTLEEGGYSIEFNVHAEGLVSSVMLHVRGSGDPIGAIVRMCKGNHWAALDTSTGEFLDLANPSSEGWDSFRGFRDQVLGGGDRPAHRRSWWKRVLGILGGREPTAR